MVGTLLGFASGCSDDPGSKAAGGSGGASAGASAAGTSSGGSSSGGSGGGAIAGSTSGGSGVVSAVPCTGTYGAAMPALQEAMNISINGISLTADELEVYYARNDAAAPGAQPQIVRRTRSAKTQPFGDFEVLTALDGVCPADHLRVNPDISEDGLSLYVTCTRAIDDPLASEGVSPLRVARRDERSAPFVLAPEQVGGVFASAGISADELTAYTDGEVFDTAPQLFTRASKAEMFVGPQPVPGISTPYRSPDISSDGLALFGATRNMATGTTAIYRALRPSKDSAFAAPVALELGLPVMSAVGAPNITASCALYFVAVLPNMPNMIHVAYQP